VTQTLAPPPPAGAPSRGSRLRGIDWRSYAIYIGFAVVFLLFAIFLADDGFLSGTNLLNIFRQTAIISVMAVAMTFVISAAQIDLSVGSVAGLSSVCAALAISATGSALFGVLAGLAVGLVVGIVNGSLVTFLGMPSFLVTLAMLGIAFGLAQLITKSSPIPILNEWFNGIFGGGNLGPIPGLLLWTVVAVAIGWVVLNKTRFGRRVLATGGNRVAAEYTGVNTRRITFTVMLVSSVVADRRDALRRAAGVRPLPMGHG
jgi:ribose transport system permease protein